MGIRELLKKANDFINEVEADDLRLMEIEADAAKHGAEMCGCHNCISLAQSMILRYYAECSRLTDPNPPKPELPAHIGPDNCDHDLLQ